MEREKLESIEGLVRDYTGKVCRGRQVGGIGGLSQFIKARVLNAHVLDIVRLAQ